MTLHSFDFRAKLAPALSAVAGVFPRALRVASHRHGEMAATGVMGTPVRVDVAVSPRQGPDGLSKQAYQIHVISVSQAVAQEVTGMFSSQFAEAGLAPPEVALRHTRTGGFTRVLIRVSSDRERLGYLVRCVQQVGDMPGVRRIWWETVPG